MTMNLLSRGAPPAAVATGTAPDMRTRRASRDARGTPAARTRISLRPPQAGVPEHRREPLGEQPAQDRPGGFGVVDPRELARRRRKASGACAADHGPALDLVVEQAVRG